MALDALSIIVTTPEIMLPLRALHGGVGGLLVGISFAVIARVSQVHKTFGYLLFVQFGLGGFGVMLLPPLAPMYGTAALFLALIAFSAVSLVMLSFLGDYPIQKPDPSKAVAPIQSKPLASALAAVFLFQAANMGLYAYIIDLGQQAGLDIKFISPTLGISAWIGLLGSGLVILFSTRFGRTLPLVVAIGMTTLATFALHFSQMAMIFWLANVLVGVTWAFSIAYLLGICAEFDKAGKMAALGGFASKPGWHPAPLWRR